MLVATPRYLPKVNHDFKIYVESFEVPPPPEGVLFKESNGGDLSPSRMPQAPVVAVETVDSISLNEMVGIQIFVY